MAIEDAYALATTAMNFGNVAVAQEGFSIMRKKGGDRYENAHTRRADPCHHNRYLGNYSILRLKYLAIRRRGH